ncbi:MAG: hypothetical protein LBS01_07895 [Prevotellaceae bacterium]|jgi:hypothetical protein|nr:hypothetical protein [Prevotellaceae bacterium]
MNFLDKILQQTSVSVVGMVKNAGKTETFNYILSSLKTLDKRIAVTSVGLDGEQTDQIYGTQKPEITIYEGMLFVTVEKFFAQKTFEARIVHSGDNSGILGKLITAEALTSGKVILSGAADTQTLKQIIARNREFGADMTLIDGATSRLSPASPAVTDAMILSTGAALSPDIETIANKTKFVVALISLPLASNSLRDILLTIEKGLFCVDENMQLVDLKIESALLFDNFLNDNILSVIKKTDTMFVGGAANDRLLTFLTVNVLNKKTSYSLVVSDFTKLFISPQVYNVFTKKGGKIFVLNRTNLIAITVNPTSPEGFTVNSAKLQAALREKIDVPVFNVREI